MLKKTITYEDFNGNPVTEDFFFHLSKADLAEMELTLHKDGLANHFRKIVELQDGRAIIETFKDILSRSYGVKSEDGKHFEKTPEMAQKFLQTDAYSELFMELITNTDSAVAFIRGVVPSSMTEEIDKAIQDSELPESDVIAKIKEKVDENLARTSAKGVALPPENTGEPAWIREDRDPTENEIRSMTPDQLRDAYRRKNDRKAS